MFLIYEDVHRYMSNNTTRTPIGYVKTEEEANALCKKMTDNMREKNESNSMAWRSYSYKAINYLNIDYIK